MLSCEKVSWLSIFPRQVVDAVFSVRFSAIRLPR
jgi:hypothetical protein